MTPTHRLPAVLGAVQCAIVATTGSGYVDVELTETMPGLRLRLPADQLEPIAPPLPPEPPSGSAAATSFSVWLRGYRGWFDGFKDDGTATELLTWEQLHARHPGDVQVLVRDPAATAPELPWIQNGSEIAVVKDAADGHPIWIGLRQNAWTPEAAEQAALAVLRAVREARNA